MGRKRKERGEGGREGGTEEGNEGRMIAFLIISYLISEVLIKSITHRLYS